MLHTTGGFRGTRVGVTEGNRSTLQPEVPDAEPAPRFQITYWCPQGHSTRCVFARLPEEQIPAAWDCARCGLPASRNPAVDSETPALHAPKSHLNYVKERRSDSEGAQLLADALARLHAASGRADS